jgi:hypothetical protein
VCLGGGDDGSLTRGHAFTYRIVAVRVEKMPINVVCPKCGKQLQAADDWGGRQAPCPQCQGMIEIPVVAGLAQANLGDDAAIRLLLPVGRSLWAIAAGYFGLFSMVFCPAPIAIILGLVAIRDIKKHPEKHGMGRAIFGLVMGIVFSLGLVLGLIAIANS